MGEGAFPRNKGKGGGGARKFFCKTLKWNNVLIFKKLL